MVLENTQEKYKVFQITHFEGRLFSLKIADTRESFGFCSVSGQTDYLMYDHRSLSNNQDIGTNRISLRL